MGGQRNTHFGRLGHRRESTIPHFSKKEVPNKSVDTGSNIVSQDEYNELAAKLVMLDRAAWLERLEEHLEAGKQMIYGEEVADAQQILEGVILPRHVESELRYFFGKNREAFKDLSSNGSFDIDAFASALECSKEEAQQVMAFFVLFKNKYDIINLFEHYEGPGWEHLKEKHVDIDRLKDVFRNEEFYNSITDIVLEKSLPTLVKNIGPSQLLDFVHHLRVFKFYDFANEADEISMHRLDTLRQAGEQKKEELRAYLKSLDIKSALRSLQSYEILFGQVSLEDFLELFPNWHEANSFTRSYIMRKYSLDQPSEFDSTTLDDEEEAISDKDLSVKGQQETTKPADLWFDQPDDLAGRAQGAGKSRHRNMAFVAAALVGALTVAGGFLSENGKGDREHDHIEAKTESKRFTFVPRLENDHVTSVDNMRAEFENIEANSANESNDFVSVPKFTGMLATDVFTSIRENGKLAYEKGYEFSPNPDNIDDENAVRYTFAQRVFAQGVILYPPELGKVDIDTLYLEGFSDEDYTVEKGPGGRYRVKLNAPPKDPVLVAYDVLAVKAYERVEYEGEEMSVPVVQDPDLKNLNQHWGVNLREEGGNMQLAVKLEGMVRDAYRYPQTDQEKELSFDEARTKKIGDCDVSNLELMALLHQNGIPAVLVADYNPVPGRRPHAEVRAVVVNEHGNQFVVKLNATPTGFTEHGVENIARASTGTQENKSMVEQFTPSADRKVLLDLISRRDQEVLSQSVEQGASIPLPNQKDLFSRVNEFGHDSVEKNYIHRLFERGIWGYAEYMLARSGFLVGDQIVDKQNIAYLTQDLLFFLQEKHVIGLDEDPYDWSRSIDLEKAQEIRFLVDTEFPMERIHKNLL